MASNGHGPDSHDSDFGRLWNPAGRNEHNPFIAFRQMVDQQFSTMLRMLDEQTHQPGQRPTKQQQAKNAPDETQSRLFGIFSQPPLYERAMTRSSESESKEEESTSPQHGCSRWRNRWRRHHHRRHHDEGVDNSGESSGMTDRDPHSTFTVHHQGSFGPVMAALFSPHVGTTSYETWRVFSPYSPAHLATDPSLPAAMQSRWHPAFLDLLALHNGEAMTQKPEARCADLYEAQGKLFKSKDRRATNWEDEETGGFGGEGFGAEGLGALAPHGGELWTGRHGTEHEAGWLSSFLDNFFAGPQMEHGRKSLEQRFKEETALTEEDLYRWFLQQHGTDNSRKSRPARDDSRISTNEISRTTDTDNSSYPIPAYFASSPSPNLTNEPSQEQLVAEETARTVAQAYQSQPSPSAWFQHKEHRFNMQRAWADAREEEGKKRAKMAAAGAGGGLAADAGTDTIIATLTQSHTTRSSDGSSRTFSRTTRRFADGREETREDVQEGPGPGSLPSNASNGVLGSAAAESSPKMKEKRAGSGWFWS